MIIICIIVTVIITIVFIIVFIIIIVMYVYIYIYIYESLHKMNQQKKVALPYHVLIMCIVIVTLLLKVIIWFDRNET